MTKLLFITKGNKKGLCKREVVNTFENSEDMNEIRSSVENARERLFTTWASVEMKDKDGEIIPIDEIIAQQDTLLKRNGPITDEHSNKVVGETLAYKVLEHPKTKTKGVMHLNKIFDDHELDDKIWEEIKSGERTGSSVGGYNMSQSFGHDKDSGEMVKYLTDFRQFETASVHSPANPMALNEAYSVVAKSKQTEVLKPFDGYSNFNDCVKQNQEKDNPEGYCEEIMERVEKMENIKKKSLGELFPEMDDVFLEKFIQTLSWAQKGESVINTEKKEELVKKDEEVQKMDEELKKSLDAITESIKKNADAIEEMNKTKKAEEEEKPAEEEEEEVKEAKKEDAKADIAGEEGSEKPESPEPEAPNDEDAYKSEILTLKKSQDDLLKKFEEVKKATTPRAGSGISPTDVKKSADFAMDMSKGNRKYKYSEVMKFAADMGLGGY